MDTINNPINITTILITEIPANFYHPKTHPTIDSAKNFIKKANITKINAPPRIVEATCLLMNL